MLETIKNYISDTNNVPFDEFYQGYICDIQDQNVINELKGIQTEEIITITKLIERLTN